MLKKLLGNSFFGLLTLLFTLVILGTVGAGLISPTNSYDHKIFISLIAIVVTCTYLTLRVKSNTHKRDQVDLDRDKGLERL
jgi:hypothetical protein